MKILVINCGSSTIKFQLYDMKQNNVLAKGKCEQIGTNASNLMYKNTINNITIENDIAMPTHKESMEIILNILVDKDKGVINSLSEISAIGHRIVHGGEKFNRATAVTQEVIEEIEKLSKLAPLHNPASVMGIKAVKEVTKDILNVVVFDTAFHQTIPEENYRYAIKQEYYEKYGMRKYGFHGSSYMYILDRLTEKLDKPREDINAIICHLGSGASICAIKNGKSYDTSMGFTPLQGLVMETRCGDIDPTIVTTLMEEENLTTKDISRILNKESGRLGFCDIGDYRKVCDIADRGDEKARLVLNMQHNSVKKYIGSYMAILNRVDAIVFTGGIGENNACERINILGNMEYLGIELDEELNLEGSRSESLISNNDSKIKVFVIPTDEEFEIAKQTKEVYYDVKSK